MAKKAWKELEGQYFRIDVGSTQAEALASEESNVLYITTEQSLVMNGEVVGTIDKKNENGDIRLMVSSDVSGSILINGEEKAVDGYGLYTFRDVGSIQIKTASVIRAVAGADFCKWHPVNLTSLFKSFTSLYVRELDLSNIDVSNVTDMRMALGGCRKLDKLDISTWDTSKVTTCDDLFNGISVDELNLRSFSLKSVNVSSLNNFIRTTSVGYVNKIWLGPQFFNSPKLADIRISSPSWTDKESIRESLYTNLFNRKSAGQPTLTITLSDATANSLTSTIEQRLRDYGYKLPGWIV